MSDLTDKARRRAKWLRQRFCVSGNYTNSTPDLLEELARRIEELEKGSMAKSTRYEKLHPETVWPTAEAAGELEWKLRNAPNQMTREDELVTASCLAAYRYLRENPGADWKQKNGTLRMRVEELEKHVNESSDSAEHRPVARGDG